MLNPKKILATALSLLMAVSVSACGNGGTDSAPPSGSSDVQDASPAQQPKGSDQVTAYTVYGEDEAKLIFDAFEEATGIKVKSVRLSAGEVFARVQAEAENPQVSIWFGGGVTTLSLAAKEGLLEKYESPNLEQVDSQFYDPDGTWIPHCYGVTCFLSNKNLLDELGMDVPTKWGDALNPALKDQVVLAHPATSGLAYTWMNAVIQQYGEDGGFEYMKEFDKNVFQYMKSSIACPRSVGLGEATVTFCDTSDAIKSVLNGYPTIISFPEEGMGYEISGMALIKGGPKNEQENARIFIDWMLTKEAQQLFLTECYRQPVNNQVVFPEDWPDLGDVKLLPLDGKWSQDNRERLLNRFESEIRGKENVVS